ncbi:aldo/keto reductase [Acuticoccus sp. MNP-M23]|uniref:aldo/keto reductase n=1 Tax=Acuticoccus sp. MNP-M23 TaxID=3072793 RepID=UPI002815A7D1|nr:aldo/keto reductase [Acuticoccus sp. MNP-M23]WMS42442.1 aldo/keto reductase [Acuticoccus sp. MNP-M23]
MNFKTANVTIPKLGIGTFELHDDVCIKAVSSGIDAGYRHVDTAERYENEEAVGAGIRAASIPRDQIFVTTKGWHDHLAADVLPATCEASLGRLGLDYVDLYLIHWPGETTPLSESVPALCEVQKRGLARAVGISNFPPALMREAASLAEVPLAVNQVEYHPFLDQSDILKTAESLNMGVTAYSPLGRGKVMDDPVLKEIAAAHGTNPAIISLAWLLQQERVLAIPKSQSPERLAANLGAQEIELSAEDVRRIDALGSKAGRLIDPAFAPDWDLV